MTYSEERRTERQLGTDYRASISNALPALGLGDDGAKLVTALALLRGRIRGVGHVKLGNLQKVEGEKKTLLSQLEAFVLRINRYQRWTHLYKSLFNMLDVADTLKNFRKGLQISPNMPNPSPFELRFQLPFWPLASGFSPARTLRGMVWPGLTKTTRSAIFAPAYVDSRTTEQAQWSDTMKPNRTLALCPGALRCAVKPKLALWPLLLGLDFPTYESAELVALRDGAK